MTAYILKLVVMLPVVAGLAYASLWAWRRVQPGLGAMQRQRSVTVVDAMSLGTTGKVAVLAFGGQHLLVGVSRSGMTLLAQTPAPAPEGDDD
jgi:flagellar protein FliO/FliZ